MKAILDTGPWVALIDKTESMHDNCVRWFKNFTGSLYSTEAVLTEVLYLLNFSIKAQNAAIDFVVESVVELIPSGTESLKKAKSLMQKYSDLPMDYADATIVCLAMDMGIQNIVTLDHKDFSIYRINNNVPSIFPHP
ncbi:MAG: PIN domain-containing protein [Desulfobacterium sp.]|nr:PIN domain-containing protein [Desulfobacterium sp.]